MIAATDLLKSVDSLSTEELAWLSGYCWARTKQPLSTTAATTEASISTPAPTRQVLLLSASQTGNAKRVAEQLLQQLQGLPAQVRHQSIGDYKSKDLSQEDIVILISSTQGEGEYPEEALSFAKFLFGKRAPELKQLSFAVLALGDSSYPLFCEAGKNFDERFEALGATRLLPRLDCDLDYQAPSEQWIQEVTTLLQNSVATATADTAPALSTAATATAVALYTKENPYVASIITQQKITSRQASKSTQHIEIDLADSGLQYQAGDSLGVYVKNDPALVRDFLSALALDENETVQLKNGQSSPLGQALREHAELTQNSAVLAKKWAQLSDQADLQALVENAEVLQDYANCTPLLAMVRQYPATLDAQSWFDFLRPLTPRMYSIASAQDEVGEEVHLTLGLVEYQHDEQNYTGVASHYLSQQLAEDDDVAVFVEENPRFRLPENPDAPIIMIGAGTGVAPYRAFMQQRESDVSTAAAWLIFGNHKFTDDFLYQSEWQRWHKMGLLTKSSFAWSRQNPNQKTYVQDKIIEHAEELWQWLQQGAHIYVCGDANHMAKSVEQTLLEVIEQFGAMDSEAADDYLSQLRDDRRYQRDVY